MKKKEYMIVERREDGKRKKFDLEDKDIEDIKDELSNSFSYGVFEMTRIRNITRKEDEGLYKMPEININKGIDEELIHELKQKSNKLNMKVNTPSKKSDSIHSMRSIKDKGAKSFTLLPDEYDFSIVIDTNKEYDGGDLKVDKYMGREILEELTESTEVDLTYISSTYNDYNSLPRVDRDGKKLTIYCVVPREEMFGYLIPYELEKRNSNLVGYSPAQIHSGFGFLVPLNHYEKMRRDNKSITFVQTKEEIEIDCNMPAVIDRVKSKESKEEKIFSEELGFERTPKEIFSEVQDTLDLKMSLVTAGISEHSNFDSSKTKIKSGVFLSNSEKY